MRVILYICIVLLFWSCNNQNVPKENMDVTSNNSPLVLKDTMIFVEVEGSTDSLLIEETSFYDSVGRLYRKGILHDRVPHGVHEFYNDGYVQYHREYIRTSETGHMLNRVYKLNRHGDTIMSESNYYEIHFDNDTIELGDSLHINYELKAPVWKNSVSNLYYYHLNDTSKVVRLYVPTNKRRISELPTRRGEGVFEGNVIELLPEDSLSREYVFMIPFFVK